MKSFLNSFKGIFKRHDRDGLSVFGHGVHFDWEMLLTIGLLIVIGVVSFSIHVFLGVQKGDIFQVENKPTNTMMSLNRKKLDDVLASFDAQNQKFSAGTSTRPVFVDPSL